MKKLFKHSALLYHNPKTGEYDESFEDDVILVDSRIIVCPKCGGHGTHFRSDLDESRLVESMIEDGDYDGLDYYSKGNFNQLCEQCNGKNVVADPILPHWAVKLISEWHAEDARDRAYSAQEKRFGA